MSVTVFSVPDMTCGHCVKAITSAIAAIDSQAVVQADLAAHHVRVDKAVVTKVALAEAMRNAGYSPDVLRDAASEGAD